MMYKAYLKISEVISAYQWDKEKMGCNGDVVKDGNTQFLRRDEYILKHTNGRVFNGWWVIRNADNEYSCMSNDEFKKTYIEMLSKTEKQIEQTKPNAKKSLIQKIFKK